MKIEINYNGKYPNLCSGNLIVIIDNKKWHFPENCLVSGGNVYFDKNWIEVVKEGPWSIAEWPKDFPTKFMAPTLKAINQNIPFGCCGGCI